MAEWWSNIPAFEKVFWYFAIPFTVVFFIQLLVTFIGMGDDGDFEFGDEVDAEGASGGQSTFNLFTVRNFIIFFTIFGWTGIAAANAGLNKGFSLILAIMLGLIVMAIVAGIFYSMTRLTESGNVEMKNAINGIGEVYLTIPGKRNGIGKVQMNLQGSLRELDAMTDGETLASGSMVRVIDILNNQLLLVEKISEE